MKRHVFRDLQEWATRTDRKPLVLLGARQVGKTYALKMLGQSQFEHLCYLNFEETPSAKDFFERDLSVDRIINDLSLFLGTPILPGKTLLFFDEVQVAPRALTSLKYFCENMPDLHVAAAGSLLGLKMPKAGSFPVGKVEFIKVFPMSYNEFMDACGNSALMKRCEQISELGQLPDALHQKCIDALRQYYFIGGMPEAVQTFCKTKDFDAVRKVQKSILTSYQLDISKHANPQDIQRIFGIWDSMPGQLSKENKRFAYSQVVKGARAREFESALQWLVDAGLVIRCDRVNAGRVPLASYVDAGIFKLYMFDTGLLSAMAAIAPQTLLNETKIFTEFKGALVENFVAQTLCYLNITPYYWHSEGKAEVDFVVDMQNQIIPIEAKAGVNVKSRSLGVFAEKYEPKWLVRASLQHYQKKDHLLSIPLYAMGTALLKLAL